MNIIIKACGECPCFNKSQSVHNVYKFPVYDAECGMLQEIIWNEQELFWFYGEKVHKNCPLKNENLVFNLSTEALTTE